MIKSNMLSRLRSSGFTMIELLIVIAILGILAVAVLAALNPIEQINRGRDTGSKSDAEQLISAIDRYTAFVGFYPWQVGVDTTTLPLAMTEINDIGDIADVGVAPTGPCNVLDKLSDGGAGPCEGTDELKVSFVNRITGDGYNPLTIYNRGTTGDATYVCFTPQSRAFQQEAVTRCGPDFANTQLPTDLAEDAAGWALICTAGAEMVCLP